MTKLRSIDRKPLSKMALFTMVSPKNGSDLKIVPKTFKRKLKSICDVSKILDSMTCLSNVEKCHCLLTLRRVGKHLKISVWIVKSTLCEILLIAIVIGLKGIDFMPFLRISRANLTVVSFIWRISWFSALALSFIFCAYFIGDLLYRRVNYPVTVVYDDKIAMIGSIPFPAVTLCPPTRVAVNAFNLTNFLEKFSNNWPDSFVNATPEE